MSSAPRALPIALVIGAGVAYALTAARAVVAPDNGEFATLFAVGGVAHPSGYPLYVLWLRAWHWLPAGSPAQGAAFATSIVGLIALVLVYRAARAWGASRDAACLVLAAHAFSARAWIMATHAEVFALNGAIAAAILLAARTDDARIVGLRRVALLGVLAGLGLSNHHTIVLLAPIGLWGAVRGVREARERGERSTLAVLAGIGGLVLGLTPYAHTVTMARHPEGHWIWGDPSTWSGLLFHFRRGEYGTTTLTTHQSEADRIGQVWILLRELVVGLFALPLVAMVGAIRQRARFGDRAGRVGWSMLLASFVLAGPAFVSLFALSTHGLDRLVVERFWLLPQTVLAVLIAPHLDVVLKPAFARRFVTIAITVVLVGFGALFSLVDVREHHRPSVELYLRNTLRTAPPRAILLGSGDHRIEGFLYLHRALGVRPDVDYIDVHLLRLDWYRAQTSAILGLTLVAPVDGSLSTPALAKQLLATGRPLFMTDVFSPAIEQRFVTYPVGTLIRVLPANEAPPDPFALEDENLRALEQFSFEDSLPTKGTWGGDLQTTYARPWIVLADVFGRMHEPEHEAASRKRAALLAPSD